MAAVSVAARARATGGGLAMHPPGPMGPLPKRKPVVFRPLHFRIAPLRPYIGTLEPGMGPLRPKIGSCSPGMDPPNHVNSSFSWNIDSEMLQHLIGRIEDGAS